ncbi:MAG: HAD-IIB family hydrolase [Oribacterium sp.]|nr:HAD-IIB family hydrolase [Oribacterium sp.]
MKALFFDVDGTLLDEKTRSIPESALTAIKQTRELGNKVFINSGRTIGMLKAVQKLVEVDGFLCGCGTELIYEGASVYYYKVSKDVKARVIEASDKYGILVLLEGRAGWHSNPSESLLNDHPSFKAHYDRFYNGLSSEDALDPTPFDGDYEISKFCIQTDDGQENGKGPDFASHKASDMEGFRQEFAGLFHIIDRGKGFFEMVPKGHGKGNAVDRMLKYLGLTPEDAYSFGDSTNDIEMFKACGNNIAMGVHAKELEAFDPFITKNVDEDGVAYAMKELNLI